MPDCALLFMGVNLHPARFGALGVNMGHRKYLLIGAGLMLISVVITVFSNETAGIAPTFISIGAGMAAIGCFIVHMLKQREDRVGKNK